MKALSIKQPWAILISHGIKDIENRTWPTKFRGTIYIHASQAWSKENAEICINNQIVKSALESLNIIHHYNNDAIGYKGYSFSGLQHGAIIGQVDIVDCVVNHPSVWAIESEIEKCKNCSGKNLMDVCCLYEGKKKGFIPFVKKPTYNWVLANAKLYNKPILNVKGKLSFWEPDDLLVECISCEDNLRIDDCTEDSSGERYCKRCWDELSPIMQEEYNRMVAKGEIEP